MAYLPNYYQNTMNNYPYNNQNYGYLQNQNFQYQQQQTNNLNGKIVENIEIAKLTEVPIGSYGIFPKADMSEIYIKNWNQDGTTSFVTYVPVIDEIKEEQPIDYSSVLTKIQKSLIDLNKKMDDYKPSVAPKKMNRKEVLSDE